MRKEVEKCGLADINADSEGLEGKVVDIFVEGWCCSWKVVGRYACISRSQVRPNDETQHLTVQFDSSLDL
jgi:hypothetical protein